MRADPDDDQPFTGLVCRPVLVECRFRLSVVRVFSGAVRLVDQCVKRCGARGFDSLL